MGQMERMDHLEQQVLWVHLGQKEHLVRGEMRDQMDRKAVVG